VFTMGNRSIARPRTTITRRSVTFWSCVYEGWRCRSMRGLRIEARYFTKLIMDPASRNMIRSLFLSMQDLGKGARRPANVPAASVKKLGILGAGHDGRRQLLTSAQAGMEVVLLDTTQEAAEKGKAYSTKLLDGQISKGRSTEEKKQKLLVSSSRRPKIGRSQGLRADHRSRVRDSRNQGGRDEAGGGADRRDGGVRVEHVDVADHGASEGERAAAELYRHPLLLARRQDAAGRDHHGKERATMRSRSPSTCEADQEDADRGSTIRAGSTPSRCFRHLCQAKGRKMLAEGITPALVDQMSGV